DHFASRHVDFTHKSRIFVGDVGALAVARGHDAIRLRGHAEAADDLTLNRVKKNNSVRAVSGGECKRPLANPGYAFWLIAHGDLMEHFPAWNVDDTHRAVVGVA